MSARTEVWARYIEATNPDPTGRIRRWLRGYALRRVPGARTCPHCPTIFVVPAGHWAAVESTCDARPPARCVVWPVRNGERMPDWPNVDPIHQCRRGVPESR